MNLHELFEAVATDDIQNLNGLYDPQEDERKYSYDDTRKPKLTLRQLNKLRKYSEFRSRQNDKRDEVVAVVYQTPSAPSA